MKNIWRGPLAFFVTCLVLMYSFTNNGFLTSLKIAALSAGAGLVINYFGEGRKRKR